MAEKVGKPTGQYTQYGKQIYITPSGEEVSEKSVTIKVDDKWINIPSIHDGIIYSEDEIYDGVIAGKFKATSIHASQPQARKAAIERSKQMKKHRGRQASGSEEK